MHEINLETWPRRDHFQLYNSMAFPHIGITLQIDITDLWKNRAKIVYSPTITLLYLITRAANRVPELRQRIRGDKVIEHELVHATIAVLGENELFGVCLLPYNDKFEVFAVEAEKVLEAAKKAPSMNDFHIGQDGKIKRDDILSITVLPWLSFTSFDLTRVPQIDTVPLLAWGKIIEHDDKYLLPFFVNFHHALVDGLHVSRFVEFIEEEIQGFADRLG